MAILEHCIVAQPSVQADIEAVGYVLGACRFALLVPCKLIQELWRNELILRRASPVTRLGRLAIREPLDDGVWCQITYDPEARSRVLTKIALGLITPIRAGTPHLKFTPMSGALKMQVRGADVVSWLPNPLANSTFSVEGSTL